MSHVLLDSSVLIKWFHSEGEAELEQARALRRAHVSGEISAHIIDLALYEVGVVLVRGLRWEATEVARQLDDLLAIVGTPISLSRAWLHEAATIAEKHTLSFYDASWAAAAVGLGVPLVSADRRLVQAGLATSATDTAKRLGLVV